MVKATIKCSFNGSQKILDQVTKSMFSQSGFSNIEINYETEKKETHSYRTRSKGKTTQNHSKVDKTNSSTSLENFKNKYQIKITKYSNRSLLLKTSKSVDEKDKVFSSTELSKPLFYNPSLKGWITSLDNAKHFSMTSQSKSKDNSLENLINKYDLLIVHDDDQLYDNTSSRVLYLQSVTNKNPTNPSEYVFKHPELKHGLYYKDDFEVWQTTVANKSVLEKYTKTMENSDDDDESYNDSLSEISDTSEYDETLSHLTYSYYGRGLLICPKKNDENYGEKYFHGGFWNETLKGWVFSKSKQSQLEDLGVTLS